MSVCRRAGSRLHYSHDWRLPMLSLIRSTALRAIPFEQQRADLAKAVKICLVVGSLILIGRLWSRWHEEAPAQVPEIVTTDLSGSTAQSPAIAANRPESTPPDTTTPRRTESRRESLVAPTVPAERVAPKVELPAHSSASQGSSHWLPPELAQLSPGSTLKRGAFTFLRTNDGVIPFVNEEYIPPTPPIVNKGYCLSVPVIFCRPAPRPCSPPPPYRVYCPPRCR